MTEQAGSERQAMRVPVLDGFRGVAILGVVVVHMLVLSGALDTPGSALNVAVFGLFGNVIDAFFIISGFVLFLPVVLRNGHFGSLRTFVVGRAARLLAQPRRRARADRPGATQPGDRISGFRERRPAPRRPPDAGATRRRSATGVRA